MAQKRSALPLLTAFGHYLRRLRTQTKLSGRKPPASLAAIAEEVWHAGGELAGPTLSQWELGQVWAPDPVALLRLAHIYQTDLEGLIAVLGANRKHPKMTENDVEQVLLDVQQSRREEATAAARLAEIRDGLHELGWSSSVSVSGPDRSLGDKLQLLALQQPTMLRELEKVVDHLLKGRRKPDTWALVLGMMSLGVN